jgi:hypothetical protein
MTKITKQLATLLAGCLSRSEPELFPICAPICIGMKQGMQSANLSKWGFDANDVLEKHRLHFSLSFS